MKEVALDAGKMGELDHWIRLGGMKRDWEIDEPSKAVDGFECFLRNMDRTRTQTVLIHKVFDESGRLYRVFTDPEISELFGVLRFPITNPTESYSVRILKLKKLIIDSYGSSENPWISKVGAEKAVFGVAEGDGIVLESCRMIYTRRGLLNAERGKPIEGFESLLKNLGTTGAQTILIHKMNDKSGRDYRIFTDSDIRELLGLLRFP